MMRRLFFTLFLLASTIAMAQQRNVYINGSTENASGKMVWLYKYSDQISQQILTIDSALIDSVGHFALSAYVNYPTLIVVEIERYSQSFVVEAGQTYNVHIPTFNWNLDEDRNIYLDPIALPMEFKGISPTNINIEIGRFESLVDSFITANRVHFDFIFRPRKVYFDTLKALVRQARIGLPIESADSVGTGVDLDALRSYNYESAVFMEKYVACRLAEIAFQFGFESRKSVFNRMIKDQPIRYHDDAYMSLFTTLFGNTISKGTRHNSLHQMSEWMQRGDLFNMIDALGKDPLLRNEQIRELATLLALKEAYYDSRNYAQIDVIRMIEKLQKQSKFPEHITLSQQLIASFKNKEQQANRKLPSLPNVDKEIVDLSALEGKWLYIAFVRTNDPNCVGELATMAHFKDSVYARCGNVEFVTIDCDHEFQTMFHFLRNSRHGNRYNWTWLHFDGNYRMLEDFQVVSYPWFVLIDPEGKQYYDITPAPSSGLLIKGPWEPKEEVEKQEFFLRQ